MSSSAYGFTWDQQRTPKDARLHLELRGTTPKAWPRMLVLRYLRCSSFKW
jgi:hypothetical protein